MDRIPMCDITFYLGVSTLVIAMIKGAISWSEFEKFCKKVAEYDNEMDQFKSKVDLDDVGNNKYVREQWWRIVFGEYYNFPTPEMKSIAKGIRKETIVQLVLVVVSIISLAAFDSCRIH
jgi:hypothetical protein